MQKPGMEKQEERKKVEEGLGKREFERGNSFEEYRDEWSWQASHPLRPLLPLGWKLLRTMFWTGPQWIIRMVRLILFSLSISPALVHIIWFYITSSNMRRNVRYGTNPRNYLDIYFPDIVLSGNKCPVVLFVTGGAWIIGYKAWGALIGKNLLDYGIISVNPDYRNFPQGDINDMLKDVDQAFKWVINNIARYGGDPKRIYLVGQSAGAQLCCVNLFNKAVEEALGKEPESDPNNLRWGISNFQAIIGLSGPYDLIQMREHFHSRGLHRSVQKLIFGDNPRLTEVSPLHCALNLLSKKQPNHQVIVSQLQKIPFYLLHGTVDQTVPFDSSVYFGKILAEDCDISTVVKLYPHKSHTDPILEDLMEPLHPLSPLNQLPSKGKQDAHVNDVLQDIVNVILGKRLTQTLDTEQRVVPESADIPLISPTEIAQQPDDPFNPVKLQRVLMLPKWCLAMARLVNPF